MRTCEKYGLRPEDKTRKFKALQKRASPSPERNVFCCHLKFILETWYRSLMHLKPFSLLYCWVHKAASTSWNKIFLKLAGKKVPDKSIHEVRLRGWIANTTTKISCRQLPCSVHQLMTSKNLLLNLFSSWWSGIRSSGLYQRTGGRVNKHYINIFWCQGQIWIGE